MKYHIINYCSIPRTTQQLQPAVVVVVPRDVGPCVGGEGRSRVYATAKGLGFRV